METSLMVDDYPTPPEEKTKLVSGTITITYRFENEEFPENIDGKELEDLIAEQKLDLKLEEEEIEVEVD